MVCKLLQLIFCLLLLTSSTAYAEDTQKIGVIGSLKGTVTGTLEGTTTEVPLKESDAIYLNETVRTGKDGAAQLMFLDKSSLTITPSSEVKIDTFIYNPKTSAGKMSLEGAKGAFRFIGGALSKNEPIVIKTPVSTIGIRGGIVQASISDDGRKTQAIFLYGHEMTVANANGAATSITQFGHGALMSAAGGIQTMKPAEVGAQLHGFNSSTQSGTSTDQKVNNTGKNSSGSGAQSAKNTSSGTAASNSGTSNSSSSSGTATSSSSDSGTSSSTSGDSGTSTSSSSSSGTAASSGSDSGTSASTSSDSGTSTSSGSAAPASSPAPAAPDIATNITAAIPPTNTYNSSSNVITIPSVSDSSADSWGAWAQAINTDQTTYSSSSIGTIISAVTSLPSLGSDLTKIPTSFGTVSYSGTANGSITLSGSTLPATGTFGATINFNTQQLTNLNINSFMNTNGYFSLNYSGSAQQINNVTLSGGNGGTANLAVYGNVAEVLAGKFTATATSGATAQGVLVGHAP